MKEIEAKAAPIEKWTGSMNYPFNGYLNQPRQSLSKHEGTKRGEGMLHCDDLYFILVSRRAIPKLLEALDIAKVALHKLGRRYGTEHINEYLKQIEELNEDDGTRTSNKKT